jgi:hypothetical protein
MAADLALMRLGWVEEAVIGGSGEKCAAAREEPLGQPFTACKIAIDG